MPSNTDESHLGGFHSDQSKAQRLILQSQFLFARGEHSTAFKRLEQALTLFSQTKYKGRIKGALGQLYVCSFQRYKAEVNLREALTLTKFHGDVKGVLLVLYQLCYLEIQSGQVTEALDLVREGIGLAHQHQLHKELAAGYYYEGAVHWAMGELKTALKYCDLALTYHSLDREDPITLWHIYNLQGMIHRALGNYNTALKCYDNARKIAFNHFLLDAQLTILNNIASAYISLGRLNKASQFLQKCMTLSEDLGDSRILGVAYANATEVYAARGLYTLAHEYFDRSLGIRLELGMTTWPNYSTMARLEQNFGHYTEAIVYYKRATKEMRSTNEERELPLILASYARTLVRINKNAEAQELVSEAREILQRQERHIPAAIYLAEGVLSQEETGTTHALPLFLKAYALAKEQSSTQQVVEASLLVVRSFLALYGESHHEHYFLLARKYVREARSIALRSKIYPQVLITELLTGALHIAQFNYGSALKHLTSAVGKAKEMGFHREVDDGRRFIQQIQSFLRQAGESVVTFDPRTQTQPQVCYQTGALLAYINRLTSLDREQQYRPEDFIFIAFKFAESGPEPFYLQPTVEELARETPGVGIEFILNLGVLLSFLAGQGQNYFSGLYGPIPIQQLVAKSSLIFASQVGDSTSPDARLGGNYVIFSLIYPQTLDQTFIGRSELEAMFSAFCSNNNDLALWEEDLMNDLRARIINFMMGSRI